MPLREISMLLSEILVYTNIAMGLILGFSAAVVTYKNHNGLRWLDFIESALGFYFAGIYVFVAITDPGDIDPVAFGQIFIRPVITLLLVALAAGAIVRMRIRRSG